MPSNNPPVSQSNGRKQSERVVPAIPLALSKSKSAKAKAKVDSDTKVGSNPSISQPPASDGTSAPTVNGGGPTQVDEEAMARVKSTDGPVTMPLTDTPSSRGSTAMSLSFGGSPEITDVDSPQPSTPPPMQTDSPASTTSPTSSRKLSQRFDMRQIRTELPPAFVPSAEQHTPKSASSSQFSRPLNLRGHAHPSHPSAASIVFGGQDSSSSSPAPPQSNGSGFASPTHASFGPAQQPFFVPQGHSHHASEPHGYPPRFGGYMQGWRPGQAYPQPMPQAPPFHPHGHNSFQYRPRDAHMPSTAHQTNGQASRSRSPSQTSSTAHEQRKNSHNTRSPLSPEPSAENPKTVMSPEPKATFQGPVNIRQQPFHPQMAPPPPFQHPDVAASIANAEGLRDHILTNLSNIYFSDCQLAINDDYNEYIQMMDCHKMILARSPALLDLIQSSQHGARRVPVRLEGAYLRASTLMDAVKYLYGGPLLQLDHQRPGSAGGEHIPSNVDRMGTALQHIATGVWLKVTPISHRGVEVATGLLHWETIATALAFALDGGLSHVWTVEDGSEDRVSVSSSEESLSRPDLTTVPTYDPYSTHLLQRIIDFIVHVFPINFYLDAAAPQITSCPRLPSLPPARKESRPRSDPRLSQIRFGEMAMDDHQRPSFATTTVSSILLSLPFQILKCVLEHYELAARLGQETVASIMRQVIAEREARRTKALDAMASGSSNITADPQLVQNLYWEEFVETSAHHRAGFRLARRKRDIDTPPSSGACSERNK